MEHKTSREKAWTASSNKPKVNNNLEDTDILNLNLENDSFQEVEEVEEKVELSEEEKLEIRKKIAFLLVFVFIAFIGSLTIKQIFIMIITQVVLKTLYEILCLPITVKVIDKVKRYEY